MKFSNKQKYTLYIAVVLIALMALFTREFLTIDTDATKVDNENVNIYYED